MSGGKPENQAIGFGLRQRLLLSFIAISGFGVVAAVVGNYAFYAIGEALQQVTEKSVPPAIATLEFAQSTERIVAAGPALLAANNKSEVASTSRAAEQEVKEASRLLDNLPATGLAEEKLSDIQAVFNQIAANLATLKLAALRRIDATDREATLVRDTFVVYSQFRSVWTTKFEELKSLIATLQKSLNTSGGSSEEQSAAINRLSAAIRDVAPLEQIQKEAAVTFEALVRAANGSTHADLNTIQAQIEQSIRRIDDLVSGLDPDVWFELIAPLRQLRAGALGDSSIGAVRQVELEAALEGRRLTVENSVLAAQLSNAVEDLASAAKQGIAAATDETRSVQKLGRLGLLGVVALSLISSVLIVWLYVGRNIVARLTALSARMLTLAQGDLKSPLPQGGTDEIGRMAEALRVFQAAAIEIEETNLREIREARTRLSEAIASISEGFALYDADDKLIVCNERYKELFASLSDVMVPGTSFESIARATVERGLVTDAEGRRESWLKERLEQHRAPAGTHIQQRSDGRWIQVSERKTANGGVVAIYADITELKQRERDLEAARDAAAEASRTMEEAYRELKVTQANLIHSEKMASLGQLTAGIAHEIKNPLNFVNNFAGVSAELLDELRGTLGPALGGLKLETRGEAEGLIEMLNSNLSKIVEHGRRADGIVKSMLLHSRGVAGERQNVNLNSLIDEALNLAYHGARAQDQNFNITLERDLDSNLSPLEVVPQDLMRMFLNLFTNGFYATKKRREAAYASEDYQPVLRVTTRNTGDQVEVRVRDNGIGVSPDVQAKMFTPFFTTKPTGQGTGLGLSISYDIVVQQHGGTIAVDGRLNEFTEFVIRLPRKRAPDEKPRMTMGATV
jgi:signal transduction histidine kinase/methyl-accepting chemotaxis protein